MSDDTPYALFFVWRVGGALFCIAIVTACICACRMCSRKARRPVSNNTTVLATISRRDAQNYPMVFEHGEWRPDRSGNPPPFHNQPYHPGAPLPQNSYGPVYTGATPYNPPPYPPVGDAAPPYSPSVDNPPPPSYSVAVRGDRHVVDIRESQERTPSAPDGRHAYRDPGPQQHAETRQHSNSTQGDKAAHM